MVVTVNDILPERLSKLEGKYRTSSGAGFAVFKVGLPKSPNPPVQMASVKLAPVNVNLMNDWVILSAHNIISCPALITGLGTIVNETVFCTGRQLP